MKSTIVAVPSTHPGGLDAALGAHFGHCDLYTLVKIAEGKVQEVATLPNVPHQQGGCMAPVNHLAQNGVQVLIAGGMGMRPLMGFNQVGIEVLHGNGAQTVGEAVEAFLRGTCRGLPPSSPAAAVAGPQHGKILILRKGETTCLMAIFLGPVRLGSSSSAWHDFPSQ